MHRNSLVTPMPNSKAIGWESGWPGDLDEGRVVACRCLNSGKLSRGCCDSMKAWRDVG